MNAALSFTKNILIKLIPNEIGRSIYIGIFKVEATFSKIFFGTKLKLWVRNSLLQDYFSFGLSDLDVSVELNNNISIQSQSQKLQSFLTLCPLIKEINFYYPFSLEVLPFLANTFELSRDPKLFTKILLDRKSLELIEAQKFTYLLRMYFSNLNQVTNGLSVRDIKKWSFHFKLVGHPELVSALDGVENEKNLLRIIFSAFPAFNNSYYETIDHISHCHLIKKPLHLQFQESKFPQKLLALMPHLFCFTEGPLENVSNFDEKVFISQISWEIFGMLTQPMLFEEGSPVYQHLFNIRSVLTKTLLQDEICEKHRLKLLEILEQYILLLTTN
jgi:hypothetical protein